MEDPTGSWEPAEQETGPEKRRYVWKGLPRAARVLLAVVLGLGVAMAGVLLAADLWLRLPVSGRSFNVLVLGTDLNYAANQVVTTEKARADAILLVGVGSAGRGVTIISIPRDTRALIPGHGVSKINASHALGGADLACRSVSGLVGVPVDRYVELDFESVRELVDAVGGVLVNVEKDIYYRDRAGGFKVDLGAGTQRLNGEQALGYARFRMDALGDIGRVKRQQQVARALIREALLPRNLVHLPQVLRIVRSHTRTDMTLREVLGCGWFAVKTAGRTVETCTLPGGFGPRYWEPDAHGIEEVVTRLRMRPNGR